MLLSILDPRLWLAAIVGFGATFGAGYWKGDHDRSGKDEAAQAVKVAEADRAAFARYERQQRNADEASTLAAARAAADRARAAGADRAISGLRNTLDATQRNAATSLAAATQTVAAYRAVLESCTAEYRSLGEAASGHASDTLMLLDAWPK